MALYRYVPGREALLDGVVETIVDEPYGDPDVHLQAHSGWFDHLQRLTHGLRRVALAHPEVFPLIATRPAAAPPTLLPDRGKINLRHEPNPSRDGAFIA